MTTSVAIVGNGHVGKSMQTVFPDAVIFDPNFPEYAENQKLVNAADICFVCVPTPRLPDGHADVSVIDEVIGWLESEIIVIKSTVPPGTTTRLRAQSGKRIIFSPEYVGESRYALPEQLREPAAWPYFIAGGPSCDTRPVIDLMAPVLGPQKIYRQVPAEAAELAKYMENSWLAMQVCFAWQFGLIAEAVGADYWEVRELWALDPRVSNWFTALFDQAPGFGGKCLPKDVAAIAATGRSAGCDTQLLEAVLAFNAALSGSRRDQMESTVIP